MLKLGCINPHTLFNFKTAKKIARIRKSQDHIALNKCQSSFPTSVPWIKQWIPNCYADDCREVACGFKIYDRIYLKQTNPNLYSLFHGSEQQTSHPFHTQSKVVLLSVKTLIQGPRIKQLSDLTVWRICIMGSNDGRDYLRLPSFFKRFSEVHFMDELVMSFLFHFFTVACADNLM